MEGGQSVYKPVSTWETSDVVAWMGGLEDSLVEHAAQFEAHCICGGDLLKLTRQQLNYLKVTQVGHQEILLEGVELLLAVENGCTRSRGISLANNLSKKTSQLITTLAVPKRRTVQSEEHAAAASLSRMEITASVMVAAKSLINWLDRTPSLLIGDYVGFRQDVLKFSLDLSNILQNKHDGGKILESCRNILKLLSVMTAPQNFSQVEPINLTIVSLSPRDGTGLGISIHRTRQHSLLVNGIKEDSPTAESGQVHIGDEIIQINQQNVVGWEVGKVVSILKASGHGLVLVLKGARQPGPSVPPKEGDSKVDGGENGEESDGRSESNGCSHSISDAPPRPTRESSCSARFSEYSDVGGSPIVLNIDSVEADNAGREGMEREVMSRETVERTLSTPTTYEERTLAIEVLPNRERSLQVHAGSPRVRRRMKEEERSGEERSGEKEEEVTDEVDGGDMKPKKSSASSGLSVASFEARLTKRASSESVIKNRSKTNDASPTQLPPVAYKTQIVGGVVMRIPIKDEQGSSKPKKERQPKKNSRGKKVPASARPNSPSPPEPPSPAPVDPEAEKGRSVFSDAKEVTIGGQGVKQVTVTAVTEPSYSREDGHSGKKTNPALTVPCFQIKDADHEGWMHKMGGSGLTPKNWRRRWFVMKDRKLYYYKTSFDIQALGLVDLTGYHVETAPELKKKNCFKASRDGSRTYFLQADSPEEMMQWIQVMNEAAMSGGPLLGASASFDDDRSDDDL